MDQLRIPAGPLCSSYLGRADQDRVKGARLNGGGDEEEKADGSTQGDSRGAAAHRGRRHHLPCWRLRRHTPLNRLFSKPPHPKIFTCGSECLSR